MPRPAAIPSSIPEELFVSCFIFKAPFGEKIRSPALLFPIKYLVSAFFMQKFVVYCVVKFIMGLCARPKPAAAVLHTGKEVPLFDTPC